MSSDGCKTKSLVTPDTAPDSGGGRCRFRALVSKKPLFFTPLEDQKFRVTSENLEKDSQNLEIPSTDLTKP